MSEQRESLLAFIEANHVIDTAMTQHVVDAHPDVGYPCTKVCATCRDLVAREEQLYADYLGGSL